MSAITTHVLDTSRGRPASGVEVTLEWEAPGSGWAKLASGRTDSDGRVARLLPRESKLAPGNYRMSFATGAYFKSAGARTFYPVVRVEFEIAETAGHYHVPLLLSPYGYSTYRGS